MIPDFVEPTTDQPDDFGAECRRKFVLHCEARKLAPFHKDKRRYEALAWREVDAFLDWTEIQSL
jgi:hypothetical protein